MLSQEKFTSAIRAWIVGLVALASLAGTCAALALTASPAHAAKVAPGRKICAKFKYPGPTGKVLQFLTFNLGCSSAKKIVLAQYRCRKVRDGSPGICKQDKRILGYKCYESRLINKGYYDGKVECRRGKRDAILIYRQRT